MKTIKTLTILALFMGATACQDEAIAPNKASNDYLKMMIAPPVQAEPVSNPQVVEPPK